MSDTVYHNATKSSDSADQVIRVTRISNDVYQYTKESCEYRFIMCGRDCGYKSPCTLLDLSPPFHSKSSSRHDLNHALSKMEGR